MDFNKITKELDLLHYTTTHYLGQTLLELCKSYKQGQFTSEIPKVVVNGLINVLNSENTEIQHSVDATINFLREYHFYRNNLKEVDVDVVTYLYNTMFVPKAIIKNNKLSSKEYKEVIAVANKNAEQIVKDIVDKEKDTPINNNHYMIGDLNTFSTIMMICEHNYKDDSDACNKSPLLFNVLKYLIRHNKKNKLNDLYKAKDYLNRLIKSFGGDPNKEV